MRFLAATEGVKLGLKWAGFVSWIAREGLFRLIVSGTGKVWYGAYGKLLEKDIDGEYIVDTSHLVAYDPSVTLKLQLAGGLFSSFSVERTGHPGAGKRQGGGPNSQYFRPGRLGESEAVMKISLMHQPGNTAAKGRGWSVVRHVPRSPGR